MINARMIILRDDRFSLMTKIAFATIHHDGVILHNFYTGETKKIGSFELVPDEFTLKIPYLLADEMLKSMAQELANQGIKPVDEHRVHGLLEAQTRHLEDLRRMLKLTSSKEGKDGK